MNRLINLERNGYPARIKFSWFFFMPLLFLSAPVLTAPVPTVKDIVTALALKQDQVAALEGGKIIALEIGDATDKELAMGLGIYLPVPPAKLVAYFKSGALASADPDTTAHGNIEPPSPEGALRGFAFTFKQNDEAKNLLDATAGDRFNLSADEIRSFALLKKKLASADKNALVASVSEHYRDILLQRWQSYRKDGLAGIAPYARDGASASPTKELRTSTASSKLLARYFPDLYKFWLNYPAPLPLGAEEQFYWANRKVEDRPTAILGHRVLQTSHAGSVILARQFFVGHSYNSGQLIVGCLPYRNGSIVFYANRTSTDQVAGMGSSLKHNIGREQMKDQMLKSLERLRTASQSL